jgi:hypothetical protein
MRLLRLLTLALALLVPTAASAQIAVPNTFNPGERIYSAEVNENFTTLGDSALDRTGGEITGNITVASGITIDGVDLGGALCTLCTPTFASLTVTAGVTAATFSGSGASLTSIPETAITDGALLARVAADETVSGTWTFTTLPKVTAAAAGFSLNQTGGTSGSRNWQFYANADQLQLITGSDVEGFGSNVLVVTRSGTTPTQATFTPRIQATNQPGFLAYNSSTDISVADGGTVDFDTEVYDTAPVTGIYQLCASVNAQTAGTVAGVYLVTSNRNYMLVVGGTNARGGTCVFADMDAADTAFIRYESDGAGIIQGPSVEGYQAYFSGRLVP